MSMKVQPPDPDVLALCRRVVLSQAAAPPESIEAWAERVAVTVARLTD